MAADVTDWRSGVQLMKQGKVAEAAQLLASITAADPSNFDAQVYLGIALAQLGRAGEGAAALQQAVTLNPGSALARFNLGCVLERAGDDSTAAEVFASVLQIDPSHAKAQQALQSVRRRLAAAPQPQAASVLVPLGGEPEAGEAPPAAKTASPAGPPAAARSRKVARAPAKSGAGKKVRKLTEFGLPIAAVVILGGAAAAYFLLFASSPSKVASKYLTALQSEKFDGLEKICTKDSQSIITALQQTKQTSGKVTKFKLGETTKQGSEATVKVKLSVELPSFFGGSANTTDLDTSVCLAKEGMSWKVDVKKTQEEISKAFLNTAFGAGIKKAP